MFQHMMFELLDFGSPFWYTFGIFWVPFKALLGGSFISIVAMAHKVLAMPCELKLPIFSQLQSRAHVQVQPLSSPLPPWPTRCWQCFVTIVCLMYQNVKHVSTLFNLLCDCIMSRKQQNNSFLHKYLMASEWGVLENPTAPYAEKLMTILRAKELSLIHI